MAGITLKGELKLKGEILTPVKEKPEFTKREIWLEIDQETEWPQTVPVEFIKDKCSIVEKFSVGDMLEVDVNIRGNRATMKDKTERCFGSLNGWRVRGTATGTPPAADAPPTSDASPVADAPPVGKGDGDDDFPF